MYGMRIKELLKKKKVLNKKLAKKLGVNVNTITNWIQSEHLSTETIHTICDALGIDLLEFFFDTKDAAKALKISPESLELGRALDKMPIKIRIKFAKLLLDHIELIEAVKKNQL